MSVMDFINKYISSDKSDFITWSVDPHEGLDFKIADHILHKAEMGTVDNIKFEFQYSFLKMLLEQGLAVKNRNGFTIASEFVPALEENFFELFGLPPKYPGKFVTLIEGNTGQAAFSVALDAHLNDGSIKSNIKLFGPFLKISETEIFRLTPAEWRAIDAIDKHLSLESEQRSEYENNWLLFQLQTSKKLGMNIDLSHFNKLTLIQPEKIGLSIEELNNGDLSITPSFGSGINIEDIKSRLGQVNSTKDDCILRVKDQFVLLDKERLVATHEILSNKLISKSQKASFLKSPTAYLNAALIDLDTGFSLRAHGAEKFTHLYFGEVEESGIDWFGKYNEGAKPIDHIFSAVLTDDQFVEIKEKINHARINGSSQIVFEDNIFDVSDEEKVIEVLGKVENNIKTRSDDDLLDGEIKPVASTEKTERAVIAIDHNDDSEDFTVSASISDVNISAETYSKDNLKRQPYPHQEEGIRWLLAHFMTEKSNAGALLADDMGLGKTFMILVAISELIRRRKKQDVTVKPTLLVAPLSLIENWQSEIDQTFNQSPFDDIVVLQAGGDLAKYKVSGSGRETSQVFNESDRIDDMDSIRYSLKIGKHYGHDRLDMPGRLVLTTYQSLREYQFSLGRVDWNVVAFDEAQNIKNPNALATRAAKGLKSDFKLLATGTPVENSLKDFWCIMDTATPGLLGSWQQFRQTYIVPITQATDETVSEVRSNIGKNLRGAVGLYMLRRTKAEKLDGLPEKLIYSGYDDGLSLFDPKLSEEMKGKQLEAYDNILDEVRDCPPEEKQKVVLSSLHKLKISSIHHSLLEGTSITSLDKAKESVKVSLMLYLLDKIKQKREKVIIFATTKSVQALIAAIVISRYKVVVDIINGDTKAVSKNADTPTRRRLLDKFQSANGFGVIVMSPVAAGVGLNVVGANNVIHLERHWNPAKEAQATDRVYRIGQEKTVNVYLPMSSHPNVRSFDIHLNSLLNKKIELSDAVVAPTIVGSEDFASFF